MTDPTTTIRPVPPVEASINDNLPSSSPSGKTVLIIFACVAVPIASAFLFHFLVGF